MGDLTNPQCPDSEYPYCPSAAAAIIFSILYIAIAGYSFFQYFRLKAWFYYWMLLALLCEVVGLISRAVLAKNLKDINAFIIQYILIIIAPSLMAAACYMAFGRLVWYISPASKLNFKSLWIAPRWITPIFVTFDAVTFLVQMFGLTAASTAIKSGGDTNVNQLNNGLKVAKFGLILQMICFLLFAVIAIHFLIVSKRWTVPICRAKRSQWQRLNWAINSAALLITIRALYRVFEFSASVGSNNKGFAWYLYSHEWPAYVLDSLLILFSVSAMNIIHPGEYLPADFIRVRLIKRNVRKQKEQDEAGVAMNARTQAYNMPKNVPESQQNLNKSPFDDSFHVGYVLDDRR